ncbi:MAG: hypothetical protein IJD51_02050 [Clostridia bacterium]|nr:hypothetical protein [Clostridia bacterium]
MFGYVKPVPSELLVKEYEFYKATYCGICRAMKKHTGTLSNVTLSYDSVFLALARMIFVPDSDIGARKRRCIAHPLKRRPMLNSNDALVYTARVFAILSYYKMRDDVADEGVMKKILITPVRPILRHGSKKAGMCELATLIRDKLAAIGDLERARCESPDEVAALFGELLGEVFAFGLSGSDRLVMYECGYHLGKFIYCADAAEDYESDRKAGKYNPYVIMYGGEPLTRENRQTVKCALILECKGIEAAVKLMPFGNRHTIENIIRNIIYLGLTSRISFLDGTDETDKKD